jgi:hypothetical protein
LGILLDAVGLDLPARAVRFARSHGEGAVGEQAVPAVIEILGVAEQLALRDLDERRDEVLMHLERVHAVGEGTECHRAVRDLHDRRPRRRPQRLPCRVGSIRRRERLGGRRRRNLELRGSLLERRGRQSKHTQRDTIRLDGGQQQFAAHRRADLAHAIGAARPAGE